MADPEDCRVFVGGLSWDTSDKRLEQAFRRFGKVLDAKIMVDKDTGRPRGFGFVTFTDEQGMEDAISGLHNGELDGRIISVSKAQPKLMGGRDYGFEDRYDDRYDNGGGRGGYSRRGGGSGGFGRGRGDGGVSGSDDCFKCGRPGHWARDCPYGGGDGGRSYNTGDGGRFSSRFSGSGGGGSGSSGGSGRPDRYGGGSSFGGGKYGGDERYGSGRDRYGSGRYNDGSYGRGGRGSFDRGGDRYGGSGGPTRFDRSYRDRPAPYGGRSSGRPSYDSRY